MIQSIIESYRHHIITKICRHFPTLKLIELKNTKRLDFQYLAKLAYLFPKSILYSSIHTNPLRKLMNDFLLS